MKKYQANFIQVAFAVFSVPIVGLLTLSMYSKSIYIFICLLSLCLAGYFFRKVFPSPYNSYKRLFLLAGAGLIFYNIVFFIFFYNSSVGILLIFPTFWSLISYSAGVFLASRKLFYLTIPWLAVVFVYSFNVYPFYHVKNFDEHDDTKIPLEALKFDELQLYTCDSTSIKREAIEAPFILVESWNEYCGKCLSAMRDLHPFLEELERKYHFKHLYVYHQVAHSKFTNQLEACNFELLSYPNLPIAVSQANIPVLHSAPHFLLIHPSGKIEYLFSGYNDNYKKDYRKLITNVITEKVNLLNG